MNRQQQARRIFRNFSFLASGKTLGDLFTFLLFVALSRAYGQEGIGRYSFAVAFTGMFTVIADFGLYGYSIKDLSRLDGPLGKPFGRFYTLRGFLSAGVLIILLLTIPFLPFPAETKRIIALVGAYQIFLRLAEGLGALFITREETHISGGLDAALRLATMLAGLAVIASGGPLVLVIAAMPILASVQIIVAYGLVTRKYGRPEIVLDPAVLKTTFREALPFAFSLILYQLYSRIDVVFLGFFSGEAASGIYNVAYRIVFLVLFIPHFAAVSIFPLASRLFVESREKLSKLYVKALRMCALTGIPAAAGIWLLAPGLIRVIYGDAFVESAEVLRYLAWLVVIFFISRMLVTILTSCDLQATATRMQWITAGVNVAGNLILIPRFGVKGAAAATLISESLLAILLLSRIRPLLGPSRLLSRFVIGGVGAAAFAIPFSIWGPAHLLIAIPASAVIYGAVIYLVPTTRRDEWNLLTGLLRAGGETPEPKGP